MMKFLTVLGVFALSISHLQAQNASSAVASIQSSSVVDNLPAAPDENDAKPKSSANAVATRVEDEIAPPRVLELPLDEPFDEPFAPDSDFAIPDNSLSSIVARMGLTLPLPQARVVILKSQRRLELWSGTRLVKTYNVALGGNPRGAKQKQSDNRTPEGRFKICTRNSTTSAFHVFLGLDYPSLGDAARGVRSGLITPREYQTIRSRLASRQRPLWETRLGGWVGIHGGTGKAYAQKQANKRGRPDWTAGCIAVTDREIEEIHSATKLGTPVWIRP